MKTILLLGDSIRQNYQEYVKSKLQGRAEVLYTRDNGRFCQYTLRYIHEWIKALTDGHGEKIDIVHFNCGLWDVLRLSNEDRTFTDEDQYEQLLERIYNRLVYFCPNAEMIYALTTQVIEPGFSPGTNIGMRFNKDIQRYNDIAKNVFHKLGVEINDLWSVSKKLPREAYSDGVHFDTKIGIQALGDKVAECLNHRIRINQECI